MSEIKYTVRIDVLHVVAWAVVREPEGNAILMEPITLNTDPRENDGLYIRVTEDEHMNQTIYPMNVVTVIPATNTTRTSCGGVAHPAGFFTVGADYDEQLAWLEKERARLEAEYEEQYDWYFMCLDDMKRRAEREATGETGLP